MELQHGNNKVIFRQYLGGRRTEINTASFTALESFLLLYAQTTEGKVREVKVLKKLRLLPAIFLNESNYFYGLLGGCLMGS